MVDHRQRPASRLILGHAVGLNNVPKSRRTSLPRASTCPRQSVTAACSLEMASGPFQNSPDGAPRDRSSPSWWHCCSGVPGGPSSALASSVSQGCAQSVQAASSGSCVAINAAVSWSGEYAASSNLISSRINPRTAAKVVVWEELPMRHHLWSSRLSPLCLRRLLSAQASVCPGSNPFRTSLSAAPAP